ncbi:MAG TPA: transcriptional regulator [Thermoanaerobaculia bacterium]|nr:transcriptional regulator [Thermoanaerobaculia bacterium]
MAKQSAAKASPSPRKKGASETQRISPKNAVSSAPLLDRLIHERLRLGIISALAVNDVLTFNDLKALLKTSDGNLSVHARKLEEGGYIACSKGFAGRVPRTEYRLAAAGRRALERYLNHMESLIEAMKR